MKIKTGDKVKVLRGKDRGKNGKVVQVLTNKKTHKIYVVVEGVNKLKRHMRPSQQGQKGQIIELPAPIAIGNVMFLDPTNNKPTRVGFKMEGSEKKRVAKKTGEFII